MYGWLGKQERRGQQFLELRSSCRARCLRVRSFVWKPGGDFATGSGTSFSAPYVSGTAALIASRNPEIWLLELKDALRNSTRDAGRAGRDEFSGYGLLDVQGTLANI
ncbi:S8 family serine peptidase [Candidatus Bipolaricaulota bacterium]|nr:S8 family serine peptidase [Candidatus Bipolaricaulota bacterium]